jgi:uncharacterized membrane protein YjfL (UPF0719 family)
MCFGMLKLTMRKLKCDVNSVDGILIAYVVFVLHYLVYVSVCRSTEPNNVQTNNTASRLRFTVLYT